MHNISSKGFVGRLAVLALRKSKIAWTGVRLDVSHFADAGLAGFDCQPARETTVAFTGSSDDQGAEHL